MQEERNGEQTVRSFFELDPVSRRVWCALLMLQDRNLSLSDFCLHIEISEQQVQQSIRKLNLAGLVCDVVADRPVAGIEISQSLTAFFGEQQVTMLLEDGLEQKAQEALLNLMLLHQKLGDHRGEATDVSQLASLFLHSGQLEKAKALFLQAHSLHQELKEYYHLASDKANLGVIEGRMGHRERAIDWLLQARMEFKQLGDRSMVEQTSRNLSVLGWLEDEDISDSGETSLKGEKS